MQVEFDPNGRSKWFKSWGDEQHFMILHDFDTPEHYTAQGVAVYLDEHVVRAKTIGAPVLQTWIEALIFAHGPACKASRNLNDHDSSTCLVVFSPCSESMHHAHHQRLALTTSFNEALPLRQHEQGIGTGQAAYS
jgi:hypothetical protein